MLSETRGLTTRWDIPSCVADESARLATSTSVAAAGWVVGRNCHFLRSGDNAKDTLGL